MTPVEQVQENILKLSAMLEQKLPGFRTALRDIHKQLKEDPEIVTLLSPEDISSIIAGLSSQTGTVIMETAKKAASRKRLSDITVADL